MPLPFVLLAAKAGAVMRTARPVLAEWNRLEPEVKRRLQREAGDVSRSLLRVGRAVGGRLRNSKDEPISWEDGRKLALNPRPEFLMARQIVEVVLREREILQAEIMSRFARYDRADIEAALAIAEQDGFIARSGADGWRVTEFADQLLNESDDILFIEQAIATYLRRAGLAGRDELALGVGSPDSNAPEFLAGVERALVAGTIEWLGPGMFGLPRDQLVAMQPPPAADSAVVEDSNALTTLLADLKREITELRDAVAEARAGEGASLTGDLSPRSPDAVSPPAVGSSRGSYVASSPDSRSAADPSEKLRTLKALLDDGVITEADFERKKGDLLAEL